MKAIHNVSPVYLKNLNTVFNETKLTNLKAIHNWWYNLESVRFTVFNETKLTNLKAIHNKIGVKELHRCTVFNETKLINLKTIHDNNYNKINNCTGWRLRILVNEQETGAVIFLPQNNGSARETNPFLTGSVRSRVRGCGHRERK